jgi:DNA-binding transcriptional LysR family regulator
MATLPRKFLPPTPVLMAFEAAARHQSFTAAAVELNLTQSAVSRQIRALEELLGAQLFMREWQTVRLTDAGNSYAAEIRRALEQIANATLAFRANPKGGTLNLAIIPTFGTRWLAPRLPRFLSAHPGITINLTTRLVPFDFRLDALDAAIHYGAAEWPWAKLDFLMKEFVVPVCSPDLRKKLRISKPVHLLSAPLMHFPSRPDAWANWFRAAGVEFGDLHGMVVDQFALAIQAAISGIGIALLPAFLMDVELARGDLVVAVDRPLESKESYYLAWPIERSNYPPLQAFRAWIQTEVDDGRQSTVR